MTGTALRAGSRTWALPVQAIVTGRLVDKLDINVSSDENTSNLTLELIDKRRIEPGQPWMPRLD